MKRLYSGKAKTLSSLLEEAFGARAEVYMGESVFLVHLKIKCGMDSDALHAKAAEHGLLVFPIHRVEKRSEGYAHIALSCCEVPVEKFPDAVKILYRLCSEQPVSSAVCS